MRDSQTDAFRQREKSLEDAFFKDRDRHLMDKMRRELGDKFSLKEFHNVVLRTGTVPLEVLEDVVDEYIATKKQP